MVFIYGCVRAKINDDQNTHESLAVLIATQIRHNNAVCVAQWSTPRGFTGSYWMLPSGLYLRRISWVAALVTDVGKRTKITSKCYT
jgi:hypothetical protein